MRTVVLANVSVDDNKGSATITFATATALERALPDARLEIVPSIGIVDLDHAFRHTRRALADARWLPPLVHTYAGVVWLLSLVSGIRLGWYLLRPAGRLAPPALRAIARADLVAVRGDALFIDRPSVKGLMSILGASFPALYAARWGIPTVFTGTEIGPFRHRPSRWLCRWILRRVGMIVARNAESARWAAELGVPARRLAELPDSAFTFPAPPMSRSMEVAAKCGLGDRRFAVGVVGIDQRLPGTDDFERRLRELFRAMLAAGLVDRVAIVVQVDGRHASNRAWSEEFVASTHDDRVRLVAADLDAEGMCALMGAAVCTVATRMHSCVLSLLVGTPPFPVALWPKVRKLFEPLGLGPEVIDFPVFDRDAVLARITAVIEEGEAARHRMRTIAEEQRAAWARFPDVLALATSLARGRP